MVLSSLGVLKAFRGSISSRISAWKLQMRIVIVKRIVRAFRLWVTVFEMSRKILSG